MSTVKTQIRIDAADETKHIYRNTDVPGYTSMEDLENTLEA